MKTFSVKKTAFCGVICALAIVLGYLEHLVPFPIGIYGIKIGLANLAVIVPLYLFGASYAILINAVRIIISSMLFGNAVSLAYSLCGALLALLSMVIFKRTNKLSPMGVSICGGVFHNVGQLTVAVILVNSLKLAFYLPVLLISGALAGAIVGLCAIPIVNSQYIRKLCSK